MSTSGPTTRRVIVLGSTGSVGTNTLEVLAHLNANTSLRFEVAGLAAGRNADLLAEQVDRFRAPFAALAEGSSAARLRGLRRIFTGPDAAADLVRAVARRGDLVVAAMVGAAGVPAVVAAIDRGCDVALANKEALVVAGSVVMPLARRRGVTVLPVDSEHSAIFQCLQGERSRGEIRRLVLTASGGPFRARPVEQLRNVTVEEALEHPNWNMGAKITIDCATLMNKALEVIEAHWLFGVPAEDIDVLIHPTSIVHSLVEFVDGSVLAQLGAPDMRTPIQYALTWPRRARGAGARLDVADLRRLEFEPIDDRRFPAIALARRVIETGGTAGAIFSAADEVAVHAFLDRRVPFTDLTAIVAETLDALPAGPVRSLDDCVEADRRAREIASRAVAEREARVAAPASERQ